MDDVKLRIFVELKTFLKLTDSIENFYVMLTKHPLSKKLNLLFFILLLSHKYKYLPKNI